jgi:hypothetical protein
MDTPSLIAESEDSLHFLREVESNIQAYLYFPGEHFSQTAPGVLATSSVDLQGEAFAIDALEESARHVQADGLWINYEHDPSIPPIGRVIAARAFFAPQSKCYFVAALFGFYAPSSYVSFAGSGIAKVPDSQSDNEAEEEVVLGVVRPALHVELQTNPYELPKMS